MVIARRPEGFGRPEFDQIADFDALLIEIRAGTELLQNNNAFASGKGRFQSPPLRGEGVPPKKAHLCFNTVFWGSPTSCVLFGGRVPPPPLCFIAVWGAPPSLCFSEGCDHLRTVAGFPQRWQQIEILSLKTVIWP